MVEQRNSGLPLSDELLDEIGGGRGSGADCGVPEGEFPRLGKCCSKTGSISGTYYEQLCAFCSLWRSLPNGTTLAVNNIIECSRYGYGKRIKD